MQKRQKKKLLKLHIQYESSIYPNLLCAISTTSNEQLIITKTLSHHRATINLPNEDISSLNIRFYTVGCYEQLLQYHFCSEELQRGESVIERTYYYCRVRKEDMKECMIIFDFVYEVGDEIDVNKLQAKIAFKDKKSQQKKKTSRNRANSEMMNSTYEGQKFEQALGIIQRSQIAKKTASQLSKNAVIMYLQQKKREEQRRKQQEKRQEQQRIKLQQLFLQRKQKRNNLTARNIKSSASSTKKLFERSFKCMNINVSKNNLVHNQNSYSKFDQSAYKISQIGQQLDQTAYQKKIKACRKKRITIQHTLNDNNHLIIGKSNKKRGTRARFQNQVQQSQMIINYKSKNISEYKENKRNKQNSINKIRENSKYTVIFNNKQRQRFTFDGQLNKKMNGYANTPYFSNFQQYSQDKMSRFMNKISRKSNQKEQLDQSTSQNQKQKVDKTIQHQGKIYRFKILNNAHQNTHLVGDSKENSKQNISSRRKQNKFLGKSVIHNHNERSLISKNMRTQNFHIKNINGNRKIYRT